MSTEPTTGSTASLTPPLRQKPLSIVTAYDDFATGKHAMEIGRLLIQRFAGERSFNTSLWKFDVLRMVKLRSIAVEEAAEADLIIIAAADNGDPPAEIQAWIVQWLPQRKHRTGCLVAVLPENDALVRAEPPAWTYFKEVAARANLQLFVTDIECTERDLDKFCDCLAQGLRTGLGTANPLAPTTPPSRWGIDE